jgi:hypothetical protein
VGNDHTKDSVPDLRLYSAARTQTESGQTDGRLVSLDLTGQANGRRHAAFAATAALALPRRPSISRHSNACRCRNSACCVCAGTPARALGSAVATPLSLSARAIKHLPCWYIDAVEGASTHHLTARRCRLGDKSTSTSSSSPFEERSIGFGVPSIRTAVIWHLTANRHHSRRNNSPEALRCKATHDINFDRNAS